MFNISYSFLRDARCKNSPCQRLQRHLVFAKSSFSVQDGQLKGTHSVSNITELLSENFHPKDEFW